MQKLKEGLEGFVVILIGVFLLVNSLMIRDNPIPQEGPAGILSQAKFIPVIMSAGILILGAVLCVRQVKGLAKTTHMGREEWIRMTTVVVMTAAYIIAAYIFKFLIPTIIYGFALLFFLNWKMRETWKIVVFAVLVIVLGIFGMPFMINLTLPMV